MIYFSRGSENDSLSPTDLKNGLFSALDTIGKREKVLIVPPDFTRYHSQAGLLTSFAYEYFKQNLADILPALGTHAPMSDHEIHQMFDAVPRELFREHNWKKNITTVGTIDNKTVREITGNLTNFSFPVQLNNLIWEGEHDLILSIGQVVPHEVMGMANYNKNLLIGAGGPESLNKSHFLGALYGMENLMGRADNPVRKLLNYATDHFLSNLPVVYVHTVIEQNRNGSLTTRGLFIGDDIEVFQLAADLSMKVNLTMVPQPLKKVIVYLKPGEYKSTWLGNKSIYRTRMAMADHGEIIVIAPGLKEFGEDPEIDHLIRKYGYSGTSAIMNALSTNADLRNNLSAAAHLIHGSSENRFTITYCTKILTQTEIENVHYKFAPLDEMLERYNIEKLTMGYNTMDDGEIIYFIPNPALGLWADENRFSLNL